MLKGEVPAAVGATAFEDLYAAHFQRLARLASILGAEDPDNVAQEAFAKLHSRRRLLDDAGGALAYLRQIVVNQTRSEWRRRAVATKFRRYLVPGDSETPHDVLAAHTDQERVRDAVAGLPARQREVLVLRYWLDLSEREIATELNIAPGSVKSHAARGMKALQQAMGEIS